MGKWVKKDWVWDLKWQQRWFEWVDALVESLNQQLRNAKPKVSGLDRQIWNEDIDEKFL